MLLERFSKSYNDSLGVGGWLITCMSNICGSAVFVRTKLMFPELLLVMMGMDVTVTVVFAVVVVFVVLATVVLTTVIVAF